MNGVTGSGIRNRPTSSTAGRRSLRHPNTAPAAKRIAAGIHHIHIRLGFPYSRSSDTVSGTVARSAST